MRGEISKQNRDFQAVLRLKQPDANLAMIKWLNWEQKANIKPTWKNLFLVLCLINVNDLAEKIEAFMSGTTGSEESSVSKQGGLRELLYVVCQTCTFTFFFAKGGENAVLRKKNIFLQQQLSDRDETISEQKQQIEASEATIKMLKEKSEYLNNQLMSVGVVKKEPPSVQVKPEQSSLLQTEPGRCMYV